MKLLVMSSYLLDMVQSCDPCDPLPDGNSAPYSGVPADRSTGLQKIVDDCKMGTCPQSVVDTYGPTAEWDMSGVTSMEQLFSPWNQFNAFNLDVSKWDVSNVENMKGGTFSILLLSF